MPSDTLNAELLSRSASSASAAELCAASPSTLWQAASRLREIADTTATPPHDAPLGALIDELLDAAAVMEQELVDQRARIDQLENLSITDELTGLLNRRGFFLEIDRALARARRSDERGLLVIIDLDQFKAVNDSFGHMAGDEVLRAVAGALLNCTRCSDCLARLGGDEFAVLMTDTQPHRAIRLAHKLSDRINGLLVSWENVEIQVCASLGAHPYNKDITAKHLRTLADRAMYRSKRDGGTRRAQTANAQGRIYSLEPSGRSEPLKTRMEAG